MKIIVSPQGVLRSIYSDDLTVIFEAVGTPTTRRASHVEPSIDGDGWVADLSPVGGPKLGPFAHRSTALEAESQWLAVHDVPVPNERT